MLQTDDDSQAGDHQLECTIALDNYPGVTTKLPFTLTLFSLVAPSPPEDKTYQVNDAELIFEVD